MALVKSSEIARRYSVTRHAVGDWIRRGLIPESIITRIGGNVLIDDEQLLTLIRAGKVFRRSRRNITTNVTSKDVVCEDSHTTQKRRTGTEHRWTNELGTVENHPYDPRLKENTGEAFIKLAVAGQIQFLKS